MRMEKKAMAKQSPKEMFDAKWKSKKDAAAAIVALIGDNDGKTAQRLKSVSNGKLLKLYAAGEEIKARFSNREGLEKAIISAKFPKGDADEGFKTRLQGYGVLRLLDMHKQLS